MKEKTEKMPTINLIDLRSLAFKEGKEDFEVRSMKNTLEFRIGEYITTQQVEELINFEWTVNIVGKK